MRCTRQSGKQQLTHWKHGSKWAPFRVPEMWSTGKCSTSSPYVTHSSNKAGRPCLELPQTGVVAERRWEEGARLTEKEITGRKGCAKAFPGKVSEERWRQREHWLPRCKGAKESDTFWILELFSVPGPLGVCGTDRSQGWEGGGGAWSGTGLCTLQSRFVLARGA